MGVIDYWQFGVLHFQGLRMPRQSSIIPAWSPSPRTSRLDRKNRYACAAQNHRYILSAIGHSKSNGQAGLRGATYDETNRLESCSKDPIGFLSGDGGLYRYLFSCPTVSTDPSGLKICRAAKLREFDFFFQPPSLPGQAKTPPLAVGAFQWEFTVENSFEGKECDIDCGCKKDGKEFSGTYTMAFKAKVSVPTGIYPIAGIPIQTKIYGGAEGGASFTVAYNTCNKRLKKSGCGYIGFSGGFEGCTVDLNLGIEACVKAEAFSRYRWCLDGSSETCFGGKTTASVCWWRNRCVEYTPIEINNCSGADVGGL